MNTESVLEEIKIFADRAHGSQMRKYTPERYIVHPIRVMEICKNYTTDITMLAAALLHDVLEDTSVTSDDIKNFLLTIMDNAAASKTIQLVEELTDEYIKSKYPKLNRRLRKLKEVERMSQTSSGAQTIKYADIFDNTNEIVKHDPAFAKVFLKECKALLNVMNKGNLSLYEIAKNKVDQSLLKLKAI